MILAETCDNTPTANGWTITKSATSTSNVVQSNETANSGSYCYDFQAGTDWIVGAYLTLTKTVTIPTGGNPLIRCFRAPYNVKGGVYDDFYGSSILSSRWGGSALSVGSSLAIISSSLAVSKLYTVSEVRPGPGSNTIRWAACIMVGPSTNGSGANGWGVASYNPPGGVGDVPRVDWGESFSGDTGTHYVNINNSLMVGSWSIPYPDNNFHIIEFEWHNDAQPNPTMAFYRDGTQIATDTAYNCPFDKDGYKSEFYGDANHKTDYKVDWLAVSTVGAYTSSLTLGGVSYFNYDPTSEYSMAAAPWRDEIGGWAAVTVTGAQTIQFKVINNSTDEITFPAHIYFDDLVIMYDKTVQIFGLLGGQKVELYNSGGTLVYSGSITQTGQTLTLTSDITPNISTAYGFMGYFKVYSTDGVTLLYTSPSVTVWGGDQWTWVTNASLTTIAANPTQVYASGYSLTPTTSTITATLTDTSQNPLAGRTITFTPNLGTCVPASATTNSSGVATTTFTSSYYSGLGGVLASFAGDATYAASSAQALITVYAGTVTVDATKGFQCFINGQEIIASAGNYMLSTNFQPSSFEIDTPYLGYQVGGWQVVQIFRYGVLEFQGTILGVKKTSGTNPQLVITGLDNKILLQRRVVNNGYTDEPKNIINALLTAYTCGISAGTINTYGNPITISASYEILSDALAQIQSITGWPFRLNPSDTLDFASGYGAVQNVTIALGLNAILTEYALDWSQLDTSVYALGSGTGASMLVSQLTDPNSTLLYGLIETVSLQKSITTQGALNLAAQQVLSQKDLPRVTITVDFADMYPTGTYGLWDTVTVTDATTGISGQYQIASIKRDLTNANYAEIVLTNVVITIADLLSMLRSNVKDIST